MTALAERFNAPTQNLAAPSLFAADRSALAGWLESLPRTNLGQTTRSLYQAVVELNRVELTPAQRLPLLETLRTAIHQAADGLRRHYLNQPVALPEQPSKVALLAQQLSEHLATGYLLVALHALTQDRQTGFSHPQQAVATALHRAIAEHSHNLLIDCQLYRDTRPGCWRQLHQLAALAWEQQLERQAVADAHDGDSTIEAAYLRALLLGSANAHQLRQEDLDRAYRHLLVWSRQASLCGAGEGLFCIDPGSDAGPIYRELCTPGAGWLGLDTTALAQHLLEQQEQSGGDGELSWDLTAHLVHAWSAAGKRAFLRMAVEDEVEVCLGLATSHHFIAGEIDFQLLLSSGPAQLSMPKENPFLRQRSPATEQRSGGRDIWDAAYEPNAGLARMSLENIDFHIREHDKAKQERDKYRCHGAATVNVSPGGFCLKWPVNNAVQIRTGEIIGIRERSHQAWSVGVVRWVKLQQDGPRLGVELLSPAAAPYGARVVNTSGPQPEYQRVLVLPEIKQINQPATLIAPRLPFRVGQKVSLACRDQETRVQLTRRVSSSAAFSQFEFRRLGGASAASQDSFDSLWDNL